MSELRWHAACRRLLKSYGKAHLISPPCALCAHNVYTTLSRQDRHGLGLSTSLCGYCGLIQLCPRPDLKWYQKFYEEDFWPTYIGWQFDSLEELYKYDKCAEKAEQILDGILTDINMPIRSYLDVGCGLGGMISEVSRRFPDATVSGVDPSAEGVAFARARTGLHILTAKWEELSEGELKGPYDFISLIHVLEHALDPVDCLVRAVQRLDPSGQVYVEVPDMFSDRWSGVSFLHIAHVNGFTQSTLETLFDLCGLEVVAVYHGIAKEWPWAIGVMGRRSGRQAISRQEVPSISEAFLSSLSQHFRHRLSVSTSDARSDCSRQFLPDCTRSRPDIGNANTASRRLSPRKALSTTNKPKIMILKPQKDLAHFMGNSLSQVGAEVFVPEDNAISAIEEVAPSLVVTTAEVQDGRASCIEEANRLGIPTLYVLDGILEWRHTFENDVSWPGRAFLHPLASRWITAPGPSAARVLASWGYEDRVIPLGLPRIDASRHTLVRKPAARRRVLVVTPNVWALNMEHGKAVEAALTDLIQTFGTMPDLEVEYRIQPDLAEKLGVTSVWSGRLYDQFAQADAVIGPPTTVLVEAMALGIPTACLDYQLKPSFTPFAWWIASKAQMHAAIEELLNPPKERMAFQEAALNDALYFEGDAGKRLAQVMEQLCRGEAPVQPKAENHVKPIEGTLSENSIHFELLAQLRALETESNLWKSNYHRLASAFPVNVLLWLRRILLGRKR
ncbi:MAG: methyltransferase domain-containing protein [Planctomycetes bacterium]|nr:methyltransferase domain-containing protein [Planctomycetota bacterium]